MILSDAYYLARPSRNVRGRRAHSTAAAVHAKYQNRNISKKQQKRLYAKRFGRKRVEDMADAAARRKELASRLQANLRRVSMGGVADDGKADMVIGSSLLEKLLDKFEQDRLMRATRLSDPAGIAIDGPDSPGPSSKATTLLGLEANTSGRIGPDDRWDPLGSTLNVPLRQDDSTDDRGQSLPPLRVVVISDTHGFEGALSRFADPTAASDDEGDRHSRTHGDDYLLPQADVLLHCGDFAASGSRKTQRAAARRLDDFLARQSHIPEKIVVQGNHDPDSPAKVLFPSSKALYVRGPSTLAVNGVKFALEPFSRRMAYRSFRRRSSPTYVKSSLPECDVLVSHEPPKGVLDLTYHGFSAGSAYLRDLVERAEDKPRLWLCGHIHESRGVISRHFRPGGIQMNPDDKEDDREASTMVINASNANSGRANRLVTGAVIVEVERRPANAGGDETAEGTLRSRRVDDTDNGLLDSANGSGGDDLALPGLGEDLEIYVTRPGVRRRKGISMSVRQQMKSVRSTLVANAED